MENIEGIAEFCRDRQWLLGNRQIENLFTFSTQLHAFRSNPVRIMLATCGVIHIAILQYCIFFSETASYIFLM